MKQIFQCNNLTFIWLAVVACLVASGPALAQEALADEQSRVSDEQVMSLESLEVRGHLRYAPGQPQPFTGDAVSYFEDGLQRLQVSFKDGLKHGQEVAWYEDGQLRYVVRYLDGEPQSQGSTWYARSSQPKVAASVLRFCDEKDVEISFCDPGVQESSRIEFTP
ncbi:MAG: hypothetical protein R3E62_11550 [Pseudomonadales bacterium]|jgi:hypothetical protein